MQIKLWQFALALAVFASIEHTRASSWIQGRGTLQLTTNLENRQVSQEFLEQLVQQSQRAATEFTRPYAERCGIETLDRNAEVVLVRVPLNQLSDALATKAVQSLRNVLETEIQIYRNSLFAYQLVGHDWSLMTEGFRYAQTSVKTPNGLIELSDQLRQPIIRFLVSDTGGKIGYDLIENGKLVEYFRFFEYEEDDSPDSTKYGIQPKRFVWFTPPEERDEDEDPDQPSQTAYFWSSRRQLTDKELEQGYDLVYRLFHEYNAYDPAIDGDYLIGYNGNIDYTKPQRVQNPGFRLGGIYENRDGQLTPKEVRSIPELMRVDYFVFRE